MLAREKRLQELAAMGREVAAGLEDRRPRHATNSV
jgi:hypothetical protein